MFYFHFLFFYLFIYLFLFIYFYFLFIFQNLKGGTPTGLVLMDYFDLHRKNETTFYLKGTEEVDYPDFKTLSTYTFECESEQVCTSWTNSLRKFTSNGIKSCCFGLPLSHEFNSSDSVPSILVLLIRFLHRSKIFIFIRSFYFVYYFYFYFFHYFIILLLFFLFFALFFFLFFFLFYFIIFIYFFFF